MLLGERKEGTRLGDLGDKSSDHRITVRATEDEIASIKAAARLAGVSMTAYIVQRCAYNNTFSLSVLPGEEAKSRKKESERNPKSKNAQLHIRCTEEEKIEIAGRAEECGMTLGNYVVSCAMGAAPRVIDGLKPDELSPVLTELRKQGVNLNQITRRVNRLASIAWREDVSGELIDQLTREITEDNKTTRTLVNDALKATFETMAQARSRLEDGR